MARLWLTQEERPNMNASTVMRRLVEIEEEGMAFYQGLAEGTRSAWTRKFALWLRNAEKGHRDYFARLAEHAETHAEDEDPWAYSLPDEILALLSARILPSKDQILREAPYTSDLEAIQLAIQAEERAALLVTRLRDFVAHDQRGYMERVIREEWDHKAKLDELLERLTTGESTPEDGE